MIDFIIYAIIDIYKNGDIPHPYKKKKIKMEKLNSICLNIRVAFRKRDKDSMILFSNMLWEHLDNEGWKVSEDYWVYNDKHLLDRGIACTIQSFMFSDSSYDGKKGSMRL